MMSADAVRRAAEQRGCDRPVEPSTAAIAPAAQPDEDVAADQRIADASAQQPGPGHQHVWPLAPCERLGREIAEPAATGDEQGPGQCHRQQGGLPKRGDVRFPEHPGHEHAPEDEC